ncbi:MAG: hypothetical protein H6Q05_693 [Acidobacteria bacterium]|nr:hypothetical protein [Acidobacteriota bacterium]
MSYPIQRDRFALEVLSFLLLCCPTRAQVQTGGFDRPAGYVIRFERTGGYAGVYNSFWMYPDGKIFNEEGKVRKIAPETVRGLVARITPLIVPESVKASLPKSICSDCFIYRIMVFVDSEVRTLTLSEPLQADVSGSASELRRMRDLLFNLDWK